ncbi:hypothetical protein E2C01_043130 [Portunus trituberculatus]|uniref:Uncharacterized protein n=1 Tax=Portunus trituberculatus TaxID=210409 RepID=A0A5B7FS39_PORTR|nr:hypothetical protein [Portunus trituberculatus]
MLEVDGSQNSDLAGGLRCGRYQENASVRVLGAELCCSLYDRRKLNPRGPWRMYRMGQPRPQGTPDPSYRIRPEHNHWEGETYKQPVHLLTCEVEQIRVG